MAYFSSIIIKPSKAVILLLLVALVCELRLAGGQNVSVGVCYGRVADNLPSPNDVIAFYKSHNIHTMRIYDPDQATLEALKGSNIGLMVGVPNGDLQTLADPNAAGNWVRVHILNNNQVSFNYIAVGNEIDPSDPAAKFILPAMQNIHNALVAAGSTIKVSTAISLALLGASYPPSNGSFSDAAAPVIKPIVEFLAETGSPLLANVYPYFAYIGDPAHVSLDYALFSSSAPVVQDPPYQYHNLFDAMLDSLYYALQKVGADSVGVVVSESGWPSFGGVGATLQNARTYNTRLIDHVAKGTPKKTEFIETYLFAMFDEDQKPGAITEQHFGLFHADKSGKYPVRFTQNMHLGYV